MAGDTGYSKQYRNAWAYFVEKEEPRLQKSEIQQLEKMEDEISLLCQKNSTRLALFMRKNVTAVGPTLKYSQGKILPLPCIGAFVTKKITIQNLGTQDIIPTEISGIPVDVIEVGILKPASYSHHHRPVTPGYSIGHHAGTTGTFGCLVRDNGNGDELLLSCNHVLADYNRANPGDDILQPGPADKGDRSKHVVATLERFEHLIEERFGRNLVDAAVAKPKDPSNVTPAIAGLGKPTGTARGKMGLWVQKVGKVTGPTCGEVYSGDAEAWPVYYPPIGNVGVLHCVIAGTIAQPGDSGSLLLDANLRALGLLISDGNGCASYCNIRDVLRIMDVTLVT